MFVQSKLYGVRDIDLKLQNKKRFLSNLLKITITKKIIFFALFLLFFTVIVTAFFSYIFFKKAIEKKVVELKMNTTKIEEKIKKIYAEKKDLFEVPNISDMEKNKDSNSNLIISPIKHDYPEYNFKIETMEGTLKYEEKPKLIYDEKESKYFFEITRKINFQESSNFYSLKLSIQLEFFKTIFKSLLLGALVTIVLLFPFILFFSRTIIIPIVKVSKGAKQIAEGNLGIKVKSFSKDELGDLANTFNYMSNELYKIKRIRDDLLAVISHELRSPLGRIKGYTELLNDLKLNKDEKSVYFNSILNEIDFVNYMIGEIIEISRLELNKEQLFIERVDLALLISTIKSEVEKASLINKNVDYEFIYSDGLICEIDIEKIKRVFLNILDNSIKAKATKIIFSAKKINETIIVKVIDNGIGIPEDQLEIVFEKFYRVDKSRDRKTGGFGLGLAICKGIIKEHKGSIYFIKKDSGAELHIELPISQEDENPVQ